MAIEESIRDIRLFYVLTKRHGKRENEPDYGWFNYRTKGFKVVNTQTLIKPFCNEVSLITVDNTIKIFLILKQPLIANNIK